MKYTGAFEKYWSYVDVPSVNQRVDVEIKRMVFNAWKAGRKNARIGYWKKI